MNVRRVVSGICCVLSLALIVTCSTKVTNRYAAADYTPEWFTQDGLALLGCTSISSNDIDDLALSDVLCVFLGYQLLREEPALQFVPWTKVRSVVHDSTLTACLGEMRDYGKLSRSQTDTLTVLLHDHARYALVHRIVSDEIKKSQGETHTHSGDESKATGNEYKTVHSMSVEFVVYELESGERVWRVTIDGTKEDKNTVSFDDGDDGIGGTLGTIIDVVSTVDAILSPPAGNRSPYPAPATSEQVMELIYGKLAAELLQE